MSPAPARKRSDTPSVKHGCALEEGKMLNCVGISREKQQTWLDWLTILLSWDTIRRKPVSFVGGAARRLNREAEVWVQAVSQCVMMLMLDSSALSLTLATQLPGETGKLFLSSLINWPDTEYHPAGVCLQIKHTPDGKSPVDVYTGRVWYLTWINRNFSRIQNLSHPVPVDRAPVRSRDWFHCLLMGHTCWIMLTRDHIKPNLAPPSSYWFCWHERVHDWYW